MSIERPPSLVLAFLAACAIPAAAIGADTPPKAAEPNVAPADPARNPPFIVHNPDGTMTVQKEPASGKTEAERVGHTAPSGCPDLFTAH